MKPKIINILYWVCTGILFPAIGFGAVFGLISPKSSLEVFARLGYPAYLSPFLGVAEILALITIVIPKYPQLKEWAYAGLIFIVIGALYSNIVIDNSFANLIFPMMAILFILGSYILYHKRVELQKGK